MGTQPALFRVFMQVTRPQPQWVDKFRGIPTGNICDAMDRFGAMDYQIQALDRTVHLCGPAITVRTRPGDNLILYKALELAQPGDVLVITCHEYQAGSTLGDIVVKIAARKGIAGMVCDGLCRDASGIRGTGLPVFVRGTSPSSPFKDGPGEINGPISCGGVRFILAIWWLGMRMASWSSRRVRLRRPPKSCERSRPRKYRCFEM